MFFPCNSISVYGGHDRGCRVPASIASLSIGVLSYHAHKTLASTLDSYGKGGLVSCANEACIFFNELTPEDERFCMERPGWHCVGSPVNLGLLGGMDALARTMTGDYLLMLQNDCPLVADAVATRRYLDESIALLATGKADIVRCRSRTLPGQGFADSKKFARYHGNGLLPALRRILRPNKTRRMIGRAPYAIPDAELRFPGYITREGDFLVVDSAVINFTDQPFLISRPLMLTLLDWAKEHPKKRTLNGFQVMEINLNVPLQAFRNGEKYKKLRSDYEMILRAKDRKIREMEIELANEEIHHKSQRDQWFSDNERWLNEYQRKLKKYITENERLKDLRVKDNIEWNAKFTEMSERYTKELNERDRQIKELLVELGHEKALRNHDGNNTGLPTSQTPINKKKRIPNTREKTGRKKGGQYGHKKYVLETPTEAELTDIIEHKLEEDDICPGCECRSYKYTGNYEDKYEIGYEVVTKKIKHRYYECQCRSCGALFHTKYDPNLRGDCQYDANVQATILSLINTTNAAINKIPLFIKGFTGDEVNPCEGYVAKVQKRAAQGLVPFREELSRFLLTRDLIYWDDTVIMIMTERGCLRYYGDEAIALYFAHKNKDMAGLDKDGLLNLLKKDTKVMHDHNKVNYNPKYVFTNIECIIHLMRDLQKNADDTQHTEMLELKKLITDLISDKKKLEKEGRRRFSTQRINKTKEEIDEILDRAEKTNKEYHNRFFKKPEATLIQRIRKHYDNYFMWMKDFELPTTNNLAERSLRPVKSKMKISGQFESADRADDYAVIRTYIETCRRNGINEIEALIRACNGNPYTVKEIFG